MKHHKQQRKLGRVRKVRTGLMRSLARALVLEGRMETTEAKAKEIRPFVEELVTKGKKGTVDARRLISARLGNDIEASKKIVDTLAVTYKDRPGGYTRITKLPVRGGDAAKMAIIEFV